MAPPWAGARAGGAIESALRRYAGEAPAGFLDRPPGREAGPSSRFPRGVTSAVAIPDASHHRGRARGGEVGADRVGNAISAKIRNALAFSGPGRLPVRWCSR